MLDKLLIRNYRILRNISLSSLERVNLITGKNDTGKTTLLEAVGIYASQMDIMYLFNILKERRDIYAKKGNNHVDYKRSALSLFPNRTTDGLSDNKRLLIRSMLKGSIESQTLYFNITTFTEENGVKKELGPDDMSVGHKIGFKIGKNDESVIYSKDEIEHFLRTRKENFPINFVRIRTQNNRKSVSKLLWDSLSSDTNEYMMRALRLVNSKIDKIVFQPDNGSREKGTVGIKLYDWQEIVAIENVGIGVNRVFEIISGLFQAQNGILAIDEFENGLHYETFDKLWEIIFELTKELNVQLFATTQSIDCIGAFGRTINTEEFHKQGKMIRLDKEDVQINEVYINADELKIAYENNIDLR